MYQTTVNNLSNRMATVKNGKMQDTIGDIAASGRTILKSGKVVDPKNNIEAVMDVSFENGVIT